MRWFQLWMQRPPNYSSAWSLSIQNRIICRHLLPSCDVGLESFAVLFVPTSWSMSSMDWRPVNSHTEIHCTRNVVSRDISPPRQ